MHEAAFGRTAFFLVACLITIGALLHLGLAVGLAPSRAQAAFAATGALVADSPENPSQPVAYAHVARVELDRRTAHIRNDGRIRLTATLVPDVEGAEVRHKKVTWSVSDPSVASVSRSGVVQGKKAGVVRVSAMARNGKRASARVRVIVDEAQMAHAIPVITYHRIASGAAMRMHYQADHLAVSSSMFDQQMRWLKVHGFRTVSTEEFRDWRVNGTFLPKKSVLVTIDDGLYETYRVAYPILRRYGLKATSFVIGSYTKETTAPYDPADGANHYLGWDAMRKVSKRYPNLEFQSHTYNMHQRAADGNGVALSWSREQIEDDLARNGKFGFTALAYPFGHKSPNLVSALRADRSIGIAFGYMMRRPATRTSPLYNIPRFKIAGGETMFDFERVMSSAW